jgi:hypothetical protein
MLLIVKIQFTIHCIYLELTFGQFFIEKNLCGSDYLEKDFLLKIAQFIDYPQTKMKKA